ncbi:uncharacterized protein LOC107274196, partial [Cephus cinctus]|uniref:Uncharacterized protein LOC107274196 n=1 Tax=Cephus cinctus TaxID=211228 RepID=A0AAJ7CFK2_CEPCN
MTKLEKNSPDMNEINTINFAWLEPEHILTCNNIFEEEEEAQGDGRPLQCPEIDVVIQGIKTKALIDTGSQVTALSESFVNQYIKNFRHCHTLPIKQILAKTEIAGEGLNTIFMVIPKLIRTCILGIDFLRTHQGKIDLRENKIYLSNKDEQLSISLAQPMEQPSTKDSIPECNPINKEEPEREDSITMQEVEEKLAGCTKLSSYQLDYFKKTIWKYRGVFNKRPGRMSIYEHKLNVSDEKPFV